MRQFFGPFSVVCQLAKTRLPHTPKPNYATGYVPWGRSLSTTMRILKQKSGADPPAVLTVGRHSARVSYFFVSVVLSGDSPFICLFSPYHGRLI